MKILLADDTPTELKLVSSYLRKMGHEVVGATNGQEAVELYNNEDVDLVLMDAIMPVMDGYEAAKQIRHGRDGWVPIIFLSARTDPDDIAAGIEAGADDYITKPFSPKELLARIKAVLRRAVPDKTSDRIEIAGLILDPDAWEVRCGDSTLQLGPTEFKLLRFFMTHPERVYNRQEILDGVWGNDAYIEDRTVDVHIRRLRKALEITGHEKLIQTVRGAGYRLSAKAS